MTRIISGTAGGRRLATPKGSSTRPTSDRVREALFSRLTHDDILHGARILDLYAGSGALGLEALSRGASEAVLVESDRRTSQVIAANVTQLGLRGAAVRTSRVERFLTDTASWPVDLVLADPPYPLGEDELTRMLAALVDHGWLADDAVVVLERSSRSPEPRWPAGLRCTEERRHGETTLWFAGPTLDDGE